MNIELKATSDSPIYLQVRRQIEAHIQSKQLSSGELLPSPAALGRIPLVDKGEIQRA